MSKIVIAVNSMITHADKISDVVQNKYDGELFFKYNHKYVWGIKEEKGNYFLYFYPETEEVDELNDEIDWDNYPYVIYKTHDLKTREASESFGELYLIIKERIHNVDKVLDDIIGDMQS